MMWDIAIAVLLCILTAVMAYMGVHVTLRPPESSSKRFWLGGFAFVAVFACVLTAVQAYRSYISAKDLKEEIQKQGASTIQAVREEGGRPLKVEIQPQPTQEPETSLRKRTLSLAGQLAAFDQMRSKDFPGYTITKDMTPEAQNAATKQAETYNSKTFELYHQRFAVPTVGVVQEFKAKGMDVSAVEQEAQYGYRLTELVTSLRAMAGRLDERGDVKR
jgi:hypothetical protein